MQETTYRAVRYIRLSSADDKQGESDSIGNQRRLIDDYLKNHPEIEAISEKVDDGWSGILFDRPAFKEMMEDIKQGRIDCVICKDLSRLGREFVETGRYLRRVFPAYGVRFIAINDNIDTLTDSGDDLTISLRSIMNDGYCRDASIKTRSALRAKRAAGDFTGACPVYGYKKSADNHNRLVIDDYPASIVREIFRMKLEGHSAVRIANTLNERAVLSPIVYKKENGLPHPSGGYSDKDNAKWSATTILRILQDETYTGVLIQGKTGTPNYKLKESLIKPPEQWLRVENAHEAIIASHRFDLTQKIMKLDTRTSPHSSKVYIFSGILICGCCGARMTRKTVPYKGEKHHYYYCPTTKKHGCKAGVNLKEADLMSCVLESVKAHIANVASLETLVTQLDSTRVARELADNLATQAADNERRIDKLRKYKAGLYQSMIDGRISKSEHKTLKEKYAEDIDALVAANVSIEQEIEVVLACKHDRLMWMEHFKNFASLEALDRKMVIHLVQSIRITGKTTLEITFNYQPEYENVLAMLRKEAA